jgi:hypothetical protein
MNNEQHLDKQDASEVKNYTRVPNMLIFGYNQISPQEKWLLVCLKHLCGKRGTRHLSLRYIAEQTGISTGALSRSKDKKGKVNEGMIAHLHQAGLIHSEIKQHEGHGNPQFHITITDTWQLNQSFFETRSDFGRVLEDVSYPVRISDKPVQISDGLVRNSDEPVRNPVQYQDYIQDYNKTTDKITSLVAHATTHTESETDVQTSFGRDDHDYAAGTAQNADASASPVATAQPANGVAYRRLGDAHGQRLTDTLSTLPPNDAVPSVAPLSGNVVPASGEQQTPLDSISFVDAVPPVASLPTGNAVQASRHQDTPHFDISPKSTRKQQKQRQEAIIALLCEVTGEKVVKSGKNMRGAEQLIEADATDEEIKIVIRALQADPFWCKQMTLLTVADQFNSRLTAERVTIRGHDVPATPALSPEEQRIYDESQFYHQDEWNAHLASKQKAVQ